MAGRGRVAGKVVVVAGAASGIGRATARVLAAEGASVVCADIDEPGANAVADGIRAHGGRVAARALDATDESSWETLLGHAAGLFGPLDGLVNSVGTSRAMPTAEMPLDEWREVFRVNVDGAFLGTKYALREMTNARRPGSIVHVSSASGLKTSAFAAAYSASKAAVIALSQAVAKECMAAGNGIRVNAVCPGAVKTPLWKLMPSFREAVQRLGAEEAAFQSIAPGLPGKRFAEPEEIAAAILYLVSDESRFVTGSAFVIDNGYCL